MLYGNISKCIVTIVYVTSGGICLKSRVGGTETYLTRSTSRSKDMKAGGMGKGAAAKSKPNTTDQILVDESNEQFDYLLLLYFHICPIVSTR